MAFEINPLNQPLADGSGLTRLMKLKTLPVCHFTKGCVWPSVCVCETLRRYVPDHSSMLPCSGKGHADSLFFLSFYYSHISFTRPVETYHRNKLDGKCFWNQGHRCWGKEDLKEQRGGKRQRRRERRYEGMKGKGKFLPFARNEEN